MVTGVVVMVAVVLAMYMQLVVAGSSTGAGRGWGGDSSRSRPSVVPGRPAVWHHWLGLRSDALPGSRAWYTRSHSHLHT